MLAHRIPYPPHTGDKTRAFHIARHLARHHDLTLGCLVDERADLDGLRALGEIVPSIEFGRLWKPWSLLKGLAGLATGGPISLPYFHSRKLQRRVTRRAAEAPYDLVYLSSTPMAQYARSLGVPVVMDFVDVDSDKWRQYAEHSRAPRSWLYRTEGRRLQAAEADIARWASLCVLATSAEEALLRSFAPWARTAVIPNGIALDYYKPVERATAPPAVIFTGAMDYLPNIDAVRYFCDEMLPRVRQRIPETRFYVVGLHPPAEVRRLADIPGVIVTGTVPDVRPYYSRVAVCAWHPCASAGASRTRCCNPWRWGCRWWRAAWRSGGSRRCRASTCTSRTIPSRWPIAWCRSCRRRRLPPPWGCRGGPSSSRTTPGTPPARVSKACC